VPAPPPLDDLDLDVPALPPAPPDHADDDTPPAPSQAQMRAMHAALNDNGISSRDDRIAFVSAAIGRPVDSSKNITRVEAGQVLDVLDKLTYGMVTIVVDEDSWTITATDDGSTT
jgi:hypothetical protein